MIFLAYFNLDDMVLCQVLASCFVSLPLLDDPGSARNGFIGIRTKIISEREC